ncbi:hypothetical protein PTKIN_Ptkin17bG0038100 [Pterospermum kingtungense]
MVRTRPTNKLKRGSNWKDKRREYGPLALENQDQYETQKYEKTQVLSYTVDPSQSADHVDPSQNVDHVDFSQYVDPVDHAENVDPADNVEFSQTTDPSQNVDPNHQTFKRPSTIDPSTHGFSQKVDGIGVGSVQGEGLGFVNGEVIGFVQAEGVAVDGGNGNTEAQAYFDVGNKSNYPEFDDSLGSEGLQDEGQVNNAAYVNEVEENVFLMKLRYNDDGERDEEIRSTREKCRQFMNRCKNVLGDVEDDGGSKQNADSDPLLNYAGLKIGRMKVKMKMKAMKPNPHMPKNR